MSSTSQSDTSLEKRKAALRRKVILAQAALKRSTDRAVAAAIGMEDNAFHQAMRRGKLAEDYELALEEVIRTGKPAALSVRLDRQFQAIARELEQSFAQLGPRGRDQFAVNLRLWLDEQSRALRKLDHRLEVLRGNEKA